jgi:hypothetical protein
MLNAPDPLPFSPPNSDSASRPRQGELDATAQPVRDARWAALVDAIGAYESLREQQSRGVDSEEVPSATAQVDPAAAVVEARRQAVRQLVCASVMDLKASCLPPERVLAVVKQRVVAAIGRRTVRADAIVDDVVRWCIEEYYRDDPRGGD